MKIVIIGGGACGASAAARLRRLNDDAEIIILERTNEVSIANCGLPYYCSDIIDDRDVMLVSSPQKFKNLLNVDVRLNSNVTSINRSEKTVTINNSEVLGYDKLVMALGANPIKPSLEGINNPKIFTVRTLDDGDGIKDLLKNSNVKNAVVIGGGFIGVEMAENFRHAGLNTTLVELAEHILPPVDWEAAAFAQNAMRDKGIKLILGDGVKSFEENEIVLSSGKKIPYDIAVLAIGVKPEIELAQKCGLETSRGLVVNEYMQTSDRDIYAGGDSVVVKDFVSGDSVLIPLAGPANRQGRIIADNISGIKSRYKNTLGSAVVKVFDITIACVGNNEARLNKNKIPYLKTIVYRGAHAGYYPNSTLIMLKLLFNEKGRILGAQAAGYEGVEKRIDVISTIMRANGTIQDLVDAELCYAPPYGAAKDPVNIAGMNAENILNGFVKPAFYEDLDDCYLIDIRAKDIHENETIPGAVNIPIETLKERSDEIPKDKKVVLHCNTGFTSYVASRILMQNGFENIYNLCGGIKLYNVLNKDKKASSEPKPVYL